MDPTEPKAIALAFLKRARLGERAAVERLLAPGARHHNPYFGAGMPALLDAIEKTAHASPTRTSEVKRVMVDGDYIVVHSHVRPKPDDPGAAVVHIFRFAQNRIAELWDVGQPIPAVNPNADGMF